VRAQLEIGRESSGRRALRGRTSWSEVVRGVEAARGERWAESAGRHGDPGLAMALYLGRRRTGLTLRTLGEAAGGIDYAAVCMAIKRFEQRLAKDKSLRKMTEQLLAEN
jgi:hypothetical protein